MMILIQVLALMMSINLVTCDNETTTPSSSSTTTKETTKATTSGTSGVTCPPNELIKPCTCDGSTKTIRCFSTIDFDLEQVFKGISQTQKEDTIWNGLELNLPTLKELKDSIFNGVPFKTIKLTHCSKLNCVSPTAFQGMERVIEYFVTKETSFASLEVGCSIFEALKKMKNLRSVNITNSKIKEIPRDAFFKLGLEFNQLTHIDFSGKEGGGEITKVSRNAFASVKSIRHIELSQHQISKIESHAFYIEEPANDLVTIDLESNQLTADSFEVDAFAMNGRITTINLGGNPNLLVLKETVWRSFLMNTGRMNRLEQNKIDLRGTPLKCNKENLWILEQKFKLVDKISNIVTAESGSPFWKETPSKCDK